MKLSLTVEADTVNVLALNGGRIAVDIDGIELAALIDVVSDNGYSLRIADTPGKLVVEDPLPPIARVNGIQCSSAHITEADNRLLFALSHQYEDFGESEWIMYTGSGYLLRLDAWSFPVLRLKPPAKM
ncbi:malate transporter [Salmonella enterica]|nr:malate transporter [Salmonella enterica]